MQATCVQAQIYAQVNTNADLYRITEVPKFRSIAEENYK